MELEELRKDIDAIDDEILKLFLKRMETASKVADYKRENNLSTLQKGREREILKKVAEKSGDEMADYSRMLFQALMDLSKSYQNKRKTFGSNFHNEESFRPLAVQHEIYEQSSRSPAHPARRR